MKTDKTIKSKTTKSTAKTSTAKVPATVEHVQSVKTTTATAAPITAPRREITSDLIAARAYVIWEQQGRPHGRDLANWLLAESQLKQEIQSFTA